MEIKYYVCGMNGIITTHRKLECAKRSYEQISRRNKYPTIDIRKEKNNKFYVWIDNEWVECDNLIYQY